MGLGKTVQALSFLQYYKNAAWEIKSIGGLPDHLMYNWENEIKKFTPKLTYHIHHGGTRTRIKEELHES